MRKQLLLALAALAVLVFGLVHGFEGGRASAQGAPAPGTFSGRLASSGGFSLTVWGGGTADTLSAGASAQGCTLQSAWVTVGGELVGYVPGAFALVNARFTAMFPGPIPAGTPFIVVCRGPEPAPTPAPTQPPAPPAPALSLERQIQDVVFAGINSWRAERGLRALQVNGPLSTAAAKYSVIVRDRDQTDHFLDGAPWDRARREGYPTIDVGEVIANCGTTGPIDAQREGTCIVNAWRNSPPHTAILLSFNTDYVDLGVGCSIGRRGDFNMVYCVGMTGKP